jgi:hypothetical protein
MCKEAVVLSLLHVFRNLFWGTEEKSQQISMRPRFEPRIRGALTADPCLSFSHCVVRSFMWHRIIELVESKHRVVYITWRYAAYFELALKNDEGGRDVRQALQPFHSRKDSTLIVFVFTFQSIILICSFSCSFLYISTRTEISLVYFNVWC